MSEREIRLQAVAAMVKRALPFADAEIVLEGDVGDDGKRDEVPPGGRVLISDGDPGEPEETFSPHTYVWDHRIPISIAAFDSATKSRREVLDEMLMAIGLEIALDDTLGGLFDTIYPEAPTFEDVSVLGVSAGRWADTAIIAIYSTTSPLL